MVFITLGENIKSLRNLNGITQSELGKRLSVNNKTISSWEINRTEPSIGLVYEMANIFGCEVSDLVGDVEDNQYYLSEETRQIAQEIKDNPELRALFDASRNATPEDLEITKNLLLNNYCFILL